jgi:hypothetical protein
MCGSRCQLCQLVGYEGAKHGFFSPKNAEGMWYREALLEVERFLTKTAICRNGRQHRFRDLAAPIHALEPSARAGLRRRGSTRTVSPLEESVCAIKAG